MKLKTSHSTFYLVTLIQSYIWGLKWLFKRASKCNWKGKLLHEG